jgi:hypothetical protein
MLSKFACVIVVECKRKSIGFNIRRQIIREDWSVIEVTMRIVLGVRWFLLCINIDLVLISRGKDQAGAEDNSVQIGAIRLPDHTFHNANPDVLFRIDKRISDPVL